MTPLPRRERRHPHMTRLSIFAGTTQDDVARRCSTHHDVDYLADKSRADHVDPDDYAAFWGLLRDALYQAGEHDNADDARAELLAIAALAQLGLEHISREAAR